MSKEKAIRMMEDATRAVKRGEVPGEGQGEVCCSDARLQLARARSRDLPHQRRGTKTGPLTPCGATNWWAKRVEAWAWCFTFYPPVEGQGLVGSNSSGIAPMNMAQNLAFSCQGRFEAHHDMPTELRYKHMLDVDLCLDCIVCVIYLYLQAPVEATCSALAVQCAGRNTYLDIQSERGQ